MDASKNFLKTNKIIPFLSFKKEPKHTFKLVKDKADTMKDRESGTIKNGISYLVEKNGEQYKFFTSSIGLIQSLSEFNTNDEVIVEMKSRKAEDGSWRSFYEVKKVRDESEMPSLSDEDALIDDVVMEDNLAF